MRCRTAVTSFVALACAGLVGYLAMPTNPDPSTQKDTQLTGTEWTVESSADFGHTWTSPLDERGHGVFPVRVRLDALADQNFYQPLTLRNTVGTATDTTVSIEPATLISGSPADAGLVRIRMALSPHGSCAASVFDGTGTRASAAQGAPLTAQRSLPTVTLESASSTTAGPSQTVCIEFAIDRTVTAPVSGELTVAWPLSASAGDGPSPTSTQDAPSARAVHTEPAPSPLPPVPTLPEVTPTN